MSPDRRPAPRSVAPHAAAMALMLAALLVAAGDRAGAQRNEGPIVLEHADSLVGMQIAGEEARQLIGNVRFTQGSLVVTCSRAIQYLRSNKIYFDGLVQVRDDSVRMAGQRAVYFAATRTVEAFDRLLLEEGTTTLQSRYGTYSANDRRAYFRDNVIVADTSTVLTAGEVRYDRDRQYLVADSSVRIEDQHNGVVTLSDHFENDKPNRYGKWTGNPRLFQAGGGGGAPAETLFVSGATIESFGDSLRRLVVTDSVRIFREGLSGTAGLAVFHLGRDSMALYRNPYLWYSEEGGVENQVSGDSVTMSMRGHAADHVRVMGNAIAVSEADSVPGNRYDQLAGQEIILYFDGNRLRTIDVIATATSLYYLYEEGRPNGLNKSSGDEVTIRFRDGRVESIRLAENVEGKYVPERMVKGKESEYNLPGFRWRTDRPERPR
jgi:lipopolysaccharide export system protein LptA